VVCQSDCDIVRIGPFEIHFDDVQSIGTQALHVRHSPYGFSGQPDVLLN
jgi:hypothetical protein